MLQPGENAAAWQRLKAAAHAAPLLPSKARSRWGAEFKGGQVPSLIHSQISLVGDEGHPSECHPTHSGWCFQHSVGAADVLA